ncbi:MAG: capsular exopolysaccharide family [Eubacterium sp.]|jgi:capsular exopolysaccharide synthesis family protein|nr:capsular exopolysaccharide family [Eubacterium sp.]
MQTKIFSEIDLRNKKLQNAYSTLIGNLHLIGKERKLKSIAITSCSNEEGKTQLAADLAINLAIMGKKILLIDLDFRKTSNSKNDKTRAFGAYGIYQYFTCSVEISDILCKTNFENLYYINAGKPNGNPMSIICSEKLGTFINQEEKKYDLIIIDTSSIGDTPDSVIISAMADAAVLIAKKGYTKISDIIKAQDQLLKADANLIGVILNRYGKIRRKDTSAVDYYQKVQTVKNISVSNL